MNKSTNLCNFMDCKRMANYGYTTGKKTRCYTHKLSQMVNKSSNKCKNEECQKFANYGYEGYGRKYCGTHKKIGMTLYKKYFNRNSINTNTYNFTMSEFDVIIILTHHLPNSN